jgi:hypothetical protein
VKFFEVGDLVLKWDKSHEEKGKHTKFQKLWLGPFQVAKKIGPSTFILQTLEGIEESLHANGLILKIFFFLKTLQFLYIAVNMFFDILV